MQEHEPQPNITDQEPNWLIRHWKVLAIGTLGIALIAGCATVTSALHHYGVIEFDSLNLPGTHDFILRLHFSRINMHTREITPILKSVSDRAALKYIKLSHQVRDCIIQLTKTPSYPWEIYATCDYFQP